MPVHTPLQSGAHHAVGSRKYLESWCPEEETQVPEAIPNSELDLFPGGRSGGD